MENASKALIIAGAILLSILIVSLGIMVYNNAKSTVNSANLDSQTIQSFNSQWEGYIGKNKSASDVQAMLSAVIASNSAESKSAGNKFVKVTNTGTLPTGDITAETTKPTVAMKNDWSTAKTYTIQVAYDSTTGLIAVIDYKQN